MILEIYFPYNAYKKLKTKVVREMEFNENYVKAPRSVNSVVFDVLVALKTVEGFNTPGGLISLCRDRLNSWLESNNLNELTVGNLLDTSKGRTSYHALDCSEVYSAIFHIAKFALSFDHTKPHGEMLIETLRRLDMINDEPIENDDIDLGKPRKFNPTSDSLRAVGNSAIQGNSISTNFKDRD